MRCSLCCCCGQDAEGGLLVDGHMDSISQWLRTNLLSPHARHISQKDSSHISKMYVSSQACHFFHVLQYLYFAVGWKTLVYVSSSFAKKGILCFVPRKDSYCLPVFRFLCLSHSLPVINPEKTLVKTREFVDSAFQCQVQIGLCVTPLRSGKIN